jgi:hypothetical protein
MEENLNLEYNRNILIKKAMEKYKCQTKAAEALGCSSRYLVYKIKEFKNEDTNKNINCD